MIMKSAKKVGKTKSYPREMILFLKESFGNKSVIGAEIGVYDGQNALSMLQTLNLKILYLVDPYTPYPGYYDVMNNATVLNKAKDNAIRRLQDYVDVTKWIYLTSDEAIDEIEDELDFVYIDANHAYEHIKRDIINYYRLVKPFGYIGGHDYTMQFSFPAVIDVKKAVDEFVEEYGYDLNIGSSERPDWWVQKK